MSDWQVSIGEVSDEQLRAALEPAHIPALLVALMHLNGNCDHFEEFHPRFEMFAENEHGLSEVQCAQIRQLAFDAVKRYQQAGCPQLETVADDDIARAMDYITGEKIPDEQTDFLREELNVYGEDRRRIDIDASAVPAGFKVLIIGSGMSGIQAAIRLQQAGIEFLIVDKNPTIGGTWFENTYPGCQVDSANHLYNYIFEPNNQWPGHFSGRKELFAYFDGIVDKYNLRPHIRLSSEVNSATYKEAQQSWEVDVGEGSTREVLTANVVISAVGQLNRPKMPDIQGLESFEGIAFHSARWEHQHALAGKRVVVIGTGCSAVQFVPEIAPQCDNLKVFQRSPPWLLPTETYHQAMLPEELWLFRELPFYARWHRFFLFRANAVDGSLPMLYAEEGWQGPEGTIGEGNETLRAVLLESLAEQAEGDEELLAAVTPSYPPGGKRPVLDDGSWMKALKRDNVELLTTAIAEVVPQGVRTADGVVHEADVIIYGTGFKADQFLLPMQVFGRSGTELVRQWGGNPQAYLGSLVADFPNFYTLYGPNTNIVTGSSIVFFVECQMRYVMGCLKLQLEMGGGAIECKTEVMDEYNKRIDELNSQRAWGAPSFNSWYKNDAGRVTQNWPGTHWEWWDGNAEARSAGFCWRLRQCCRRLRSTTRRCLLSAPLTFQCVAQTPPPPDHSTRGLHRQQIAPTLEVRRYSRAVIVLPAVTYTITSGCCVLRYLPLHFSGKPGVFVLPSDTSRPVGIIRHLNPLVALLSHYLKIKRSVGIAVSRVARPEFYRDLLSYPILFLGLLFHSAKTGRLRELR